MMRCIRGSFISINSFITENDCNKIFVLPYQNLWPLINSKLGHDCFISIENGNVVKEVVFYDE